MRLRVTGSLDDRTVIEEKVEVEGLGTVDVVDADVVLLDPARVGTDLSAEVVKCVVVDIVLCALVVEVHFLLSMKLALSLVLLITSNNLHHKLIILILCTQQSRLARSHFIPTHLDFIFLLKVLQVPRPVSMVSTLALWHGFHHHLIRQHVESGIVGFER